MKIIIKTETNDYLVNYENKEFQIDLILTKKEGYKIVSKIPSLRIQTHKDKCFEKSEYHWTQLQIPETQKTSTEEITNEFKTYINQNSIQPILEYCNSKTNEGASSILTFLHFLKNDFTAALFKAENYYYETRNKNISKDYLNKKIPMYTEIIDAIINETKYLTKLSKPEEVIWNNTEAHKNLQEAHQEVIQKASHAISSGTYNNLFLLLNAIVKLYKSTAQENSFKTTWMQTWKKETQVNNTQIKEQIQKALTQILTNKNREALITTIHIIKNMGFNQAEIFNTYQTFLHIETPINKLYRDIS